MSYSKPMPATNLSRGSSSSWNIPPMNDLLKIAGLTLIPIGVMVGGWSYYDANGKLSRATLNSLRKPSWAITNESNIAALDVATMLPWGYAAFLVTEAGTSNTDVKTALTSFGATMGVIALGSIAFSNNRNTACWLGVSVAVTAAAGVTASLFGKVNETAGWLLVPFVAWSTFGAIQMAAIYFKNRNPGEAL